MFSIFNKTVTCDLMMAWAKYAMDSYYDSFFICSSFENHITKSRKIPAIGSSAGGTVKNLEPNYLFLKKMDFAVSIFFEKGRILGIQNEVEHFANWLGMDQFLWSLSLLNCRESQLKLSVPFIAIALLLKKGHMFLSDFPAFFSPETDIFFVRNERQ